MKFQQLIFLGFILSISLAVTPGNSIYCKNYKTDCVTECQFGTWEPNNGGCRISDCGIQVPTMSNDWCQSCNPTNYYPSLDGKSCIKSDCSFTHDLSDAGENAYRTSWCTDCQPTKQKAQFDQKGCVQSDCYATPSPGAFTKQWCSDCSQNFKFSSGDKKSCVATDCTVTPQANAYTDQWCTDCITDSSAATSDKSNCAKSFTEEITETNALHLSISTTLLILFIHLLF